MQKVNPISVVCFFSMLVFGFTAPFLNFYKNPPHGVQIALLIAATLCGIVFAKLPWIIKSSKNH